MKKPNLDYQNIFYYLSGLAGLFYIVLLILLFTGFLPVFFADNLTYVFFGVIVVITTYLALRIKDIPEAQREKSTIVFYSKYFFILALVVIAINQFLKRQIIIDIMPEITIVTIALGFLTFYAHKNRVEKELEEEKTKEEQAEQKRKAEFDKKFPKIAKLNLSYGFENAKKIKEKPKRWLTYPFLVLVSPFIWLVRLPYKLMKWGYKVGFFYGIIVVSLIIIGFAIRLYRLGDLSLWWDEIITGTYVTRILETGVPLFPSELGYYWRGIAYHYTVSIFTFLFGNNEFWIRFPSVLFGMGIVIIAFFFAKKMNKRVAIIILAFLIFSTYNLEYSRFARFYIMNTFLFMLAIWFFWEGFFNNKLRYKILSVVTFFIMMHTVQFGMIFMSLWGVWFVFLIKDKKLFRKVDFLFLLISLAVFRLDNTFIRLFKIGSLDRARDVADVVAPRSWEYFQIPEWSLINFFNQNYFSLTLVFFSIIFLSLLFFGLKKEKYASWRFLSYLATILIVSVFLYELGSRGVNGARIFLFAEALIAIIFVLIIFFMSGLFSKKFQLFLTLIATVLILLSITPLFYSRISINYGDDVSSDPFRSTHVAAYRADYKTTYEYLRINKQEEDIWINVMGSNYYYFNKNPDYILNQNIRWNTNAYIDEEGNYVNSFGSLLINSPEDIKKIIEENEGKKVWLLVNGGSVNILYTTHVRFDFIRFINKNEDKVVYESPDGYSKVLLFNDF